MRIASMPALTVATVVMAWLLVAPAAFTKEGVIVQLDDPILRRDDRRPRRRYPLH